MGCKMLKNFVITAALLFSAISAQALQPPISDVLPNGSVARCHEGGDAGTRAYRLAVKDISTTSLTLQVDTLVCLRLEGKMALVPYALSEKQIYKNNGHVISYENIEASLAITNTDATALLARVTLDTSKFSQEVTLDLQVLRTRVFDVSLQFLEVIRIDGKVVDQGMRANGTYRITLN